MAKQKFYVVWRGHETGIFTTWDDCKERTIGFSGAEYKSFPTLDIAEMEYSERGSSLKAVQKTKLQKNTLQTSEEIDQDALCVDGACSGNPGKGDYQCVEVGTKNNIFLHTDFQQTTNNLMEFFALVECIQYLVKNKTYNMTVYSDSISAMAWVRNKKAKTTLKRTDENFDTFALLENFEKWLKENDYAEVKILKWDTKNLGEIPADFDRK